MNKKIKVFTLLFFIALFILPTGVNAAVLTIDHSHNMCYDANGIYTGQGTSCSGNYTTFKQLDGQMAFCSQLNVAIQSQTTYNPAIGWNASDRSALIAGRCIWSAFHDTKWGLGDAYAQYLYATELINSIFRYSGSSSYADANPVLRNIYQEAVNFVDNVEKYNNKLPALTLSVAGNNKELNAISGTKNYISNKITLKGLVKDYGGDATSYTVTASASNGTVKICSDSKGQNCGGNSKSLPNPSNSVDEFYIKVENGKADDDVTISVTGSNSSTYYTVVRYDGPSNLQMLMVPGEISFSRNVNKKLVLNIPPEEPAPESHQVKHVIKAYKVDEEGENLTGAKFVLYRANVSVSGTNTVYTKFGENLASSTGAYVISSASTHTYTGSYDRSKDEFYKYGYCVEETQSPDGYKLLKKPICFQPTGKSVLDCLDPNNNSTDKEYCGAVASCSGDYEYNSSDGKCVKVNSTPVENYICDTDAGFQMDGDKCMRVEEAPTTNPDTQELVCAAGTLEGDKCVTTVDRTPSCPAGSTLNGDKCESRDDSGKVTCTYDGKSVDVKYCQKTGVYTSVQSSGNHLTFSMVNEKTAVSISKRGITGDDEIPGAKLKICTNKPGKDGKCSVAQIVEKGVKCPTYTSDVNSEAVTTSNCTYDAASKSRTVSLIWTSSVVPREWRGLKVGPEYYLVEETPPRGYFAATITTAFSINADGSIKSGTKTISDDDKHLIVVKNSLTKVTISKTDVATSQELPGAVINICETYTDKDGKIHKTVDDKGNCTLVTLPDGKPATWTSGDKPHVINGLPIGTYMLEEYIAPKGYSTAESIIFTLKSDGTLVDKDGKSLANNKLVMHDKKIPDVKTGMFALYVVLAIVTLGVLGGGGSYYFLKKKGKSLV